MDPDGREFRETRAPGAPIKKQSFRPGQGPRRPGAPGNPGPRYEVALPRQKSHPGIRRLLEVVGECINALTRGDPKSAFVGKLNCLECILDLLGSK